MKPSLFPLAIKLANLTNAQKSIFYKNGTFVMIYSKDDPPVNELMKYFKGINKPDQLIMESSKAFEDYAAYYCFYEDYSSVCLFYVNDEAGEVPNEKLGQIKKDMLANFDKDFTEQEIIFDSEKQNLKDYEPAMYIFVNQDLNMGKGKIAGQAGHVVGKLTERLVKNPTQEYLDWSQTLFKKIVLKATKQQIIDLCQLDGALVIHDAGRTQIPSGSLTVVGFPPRYAKDIPPAFAKYKLL